jgi:lysozyme
MWSFFKRAPKRIVATGATAAVLIAGPFTAQHEGLRLAAYLDPVGVPTICYGDTEGVHLGQKKTKEECDTLFEARLGFFAYGVDALVGPEMKPETHAALTSFAYNVGLGAFTGSTLLKKLNAGDLPGACNELPRWTYAKGKQLPGLVKRREAERKLCLSGGINVGA